MPHSKTGGDERELIRAQIKEYLRRADDPSPIGWVTRTFTQVPTATAYRYIQQARRELQADADAEEKRREEALSHVVRSLPQPPSPYVTSRMDQRDVAKGIDFMMLFNDCVEDAYIIRDSLRTQKRDDSGNLHWKVTNPVLMDKNIGRRLDLMKGYLQAKEAVYNQDRTREMYSIIVSVIGEADPAIQKTILEKLREANRARGFTIEGL